MHLAVLLISMVTVAAATEHAWLREVSSGPGRRNLGSSSMQFELKRSSGKTRLNLEENKRLNANAPVYEVRSDGSGKQRLVRKAAPALKTRFFHDKTNHGAFKMSFDEKARRQVLSGNFRSGADWLSMSSAPLLIPAPANRADRSYPYLLESQSPDTRDDDTSSSEESDSEMPTENEQFHDDYAETRDLRENLADALNRLRALLSGKAKNRRLRRSNPVYALEIIVTADPTIWNKFYQRSTAANGLTREQATELSIREHFVHIVNGMSLRYENIDDPAMNIYLTISGFIIYKTIDNTNPLPPSTNIITQGDTEFVDAGVYLASVQSWASGLTGLQHDDHILVFTDYELFSGSPSNKGVAGKAYVGAVCSSHRVSINEDGDYFRTVTVASHELGHNLGSRHDGSDSSSACNVEDKYVMAPSVASFSQSEPYTPNPWLFSPCSVDAFKAYVSSLGSNNCLLDSGDYYNETEYNAHSSNLPGQLRTANEQCKRERGDDSFMCTSLTSPTNDDFCRRMSCYNSADGYCYYYTPARGTDCGATGSNTYCIDGWCVEKSGVYNQGAKDPVTNDIPTETGGQTTTSPGDCVDTGYEGQSCSWLDNYFQTTYSAGPDQWCLDPDWEARCCAYCAAAAANAPAPTTTQAPPSGSCVDIGWVEGGWNCDQLSSYFLATYNAQPSDWCFDPTWKANCCAMCAANGV